MAGEEAQETGTSGEKPEAVYAPDHPHASPRSGYIPPVATRFNGEPGPGRPKGSHSARAALQRKWRKGWDEDPDAQEPDREDGVGTEARRVADAIHKAALIGDTDTVRSLATLIDQVEGRPKETVEHSGSQGRVVVVHRTPEGAVPPDLPTQESGQ